MTYKVEFELSGYSVSYTVKAQNVLEAEELAKKQLKKDKDVREKASRRGISHPETGWEVKHIENVHYDVGKGR